jgi:hypothetical protein
MYCRIDILFMYCVSDPYLRLSGTFTGRKILEGGKDETYPRNSETPPIPANLRG